MYRVLFVSTTGRVNRPYFDPSVRYRCYNLAEDLSDLGWYSRITSTNDFITKDIDDFDIYVFHRPVFDPKFIDKIDILKSNGKVVIADYDDLIFDIENALNSSIYKNGRSSEREVLNIFNKNSAALSLFENFTVSTLGLKERLMELCPNSNVAVIHNGLNKKFMAICDQIRINENIERVKGRIGYFSGTKSHDKDLEMITSSFVELSTKTDFEFFCVGPVTIPDAIEKSCNVLPHDLVGYHEMIKLLFSCEVVIAPLEDGIFNNCKSGLKYFESAYAGCNVVATPIADIDRFESKYLFKPKNLSDWTGRLLNSLNDIGNIEDKMADAKSQAMQIKETNKWLDFIKEIV